MLNEISLDYYNNDGADLIGNITVTRDGVTVTLDKLTLDGVDVFTFNEVLTVLNVIHKDAEDLERQFLAVNGEGYNAGAFTVNLRT